MTTGLSRRPLQQWEVRRQRAVKLLARRPHAAPPLEFLLELLPLQSELFRWSTEAEWPGAIVTGAGDDTPKLRLDALSIDLLVPRFATFLEGLLPHSPDVLAEIGAGVQAREPTQRALLKHYLAGQDLSEIAAGLDCEARQLEFFPRAFMQPIAEALARDTAVPEDWQENFCPMCGRLPQLALLRDDAAARGRRLLVCGLCASEWTFRRGVCPHCGEERPGQLFIHSVPDPTHVYVDECKSCSAYLKTIDLRKDGLAVPLVDEIATVELDIWAEERGLWKIQPNLLGM